MPNRPITMDLLDFIPFRTELAKAYHGLTDNATHTSEHPIFSELKVRRYRRPASDIAAYITTKIDHWIGWELRSEKTAVGGTTVVRADVSSFALFGMKIQVTFGLFEEKNSNGETITTVNAKAVTQIESKGDLGESRRMIRMMLGAVDFEFRRDIISEQDYLMYAVDANGAAIAFQQMFDEAKIQHKKKPAGSPKATAIAFTKSSKKQSIPFKPSVKKEPQMETNGTSATDVPEQNKPSRPKVTIITPQKN